MIQRKHTRRDLVRRSGVVAAATLLARSSFARSSEKPNFIVIFCDDLGDANHRGQQRPAEWVEVARPLKKE